MANLHLGRPVRFVPVFVPLRHRRARPGGALIDQLETGVLTATPFPFSAFVRRPGGGQTRKGETKFRRGKRASCKSSLDRDKPGSWRNKPASTPIRRMSAILRSPHAHEPKNLELIKH